MVTPSCKLCNSEVRQEDQQFTIILGYKRLCLKKLELVIVSHTCDPTYQRRKRGGSEILQVQPDPDSMFETRLGCMRYYLTKTNKQEPEPYKQNVIINANTVMFNNAFM